jgi:hypothetical protein
MKQIILMSIVLIVGCREEKEIELDVCGWSKPIDAISWIVSLKESIGNNCTCEPAILRGTYENQVVIFIALTKTATCDYFWAPTLYNCKGEVVRIFTNSLADQKELYEKVTRDSVLYTCRD